MLMFQSNLSMLFFTFFYFFSLSFFIFLLYKLSIFCDGCNAEEPIKGVIWDSGPTGALSSGRLRAS